MKPLSERDENWQPVTGSIWMENALVGMKPLSERDENKSVKTTLDKPHK